VAIPIVRIGSKPVDLVLSDIFLAFVFFFLFITALCAGKIAVSRSSLVFVYLGLFMAGVTSAELGNLMPMISAVRFYKPFLFLFIGFCLAKNHKFINNFDKNIVQMSVIISFILVLSTLIDPRFPRLLWGENFLGLGVYGFPNSAMSFFSIVSFFLLAGFLQTKKKIYLAIFIGLSLTIILSLSRSSIVVLVSGSLILQTFYKKKILMLLYIVLFCLVVSACLFAVKDHPKVSPSLYLLNDRIQRTLGNTENDASSGRLDIWTNAVEVICEKPLLGYGFESFSNYSEGYDTPHQQYLEVAYKTGIIGLLFYSFIIIYMFVSSLKLYRTLLFSSGISISIVVFISTLFAISLGNMTQPNFSYSLTGNFIFFLFGIILGEKERIALMEKGRYSGNLLDEIQ